jgi:hypothetical protein
MSGRDWRKAQNRDRARRQGPRPASPAQLRLIVELCEEVGAVPPSGALTVRQASDVIDGLLSRKRLGLLGKAARR